MYVWENFDAIKAECDDEGISIGDRCRIELGCGITLLKMLRKLWQRFDIYETKRLAYSGDRWGLRLAFELAGISNGTNANGVGDHGDGRNDEEETPQWVIDLLNPLLRRFTLDAAASATNTKVPENYYDKEKNGLVQKWRRCERIWLNPPFSSIPPWVRKIIESDVELVVALLPPHFSSGWWRECVNPYATLIITLPRLKFGDHAQTAREDVVLALFARNAPWALDALAPYIAETIAPVQYDEGGKRLGTLQMATLLRETRTIEPVNDDDVPPPRYWLEPPEVRAEIEGWLGERGLKIAEYDPCPYPLQDGFDGLEVDWPCGPDEVIRINAPFHRSDELRGRGLGAWLRKAKLEAAKGKRVAMYLPLLPAAHDMIAAGAEVLALGRVPWLDATTGEPWLHPTHTGLFLLDGVKEPS
jgi:phage N-6-adenine-methyltransferase